MPCHVAPPESTSVLASAVDQQLVIKIAPQRLLLSDVQSGTVVVHAEIDYDVVDTALVLLEGVPALHVPRRTCAVSLWLILMKLR